MMRRTFRVPLYEMKLIIIVADAPHKDYHIPANAVARAHKAPLPFSGTNANRVRVAGCSWEDPSTGKVYVLVSSRATIADITHEAAHAAQSVIDLTGLPQRRKNRANEQFTYLVGWIAQRTYDTVHGKHTPASAAAQRALV